MKQLPEYFTLTLAVANAEKGVKVKEIEASKIEAVRFQLQAQTATLEREEGKLIDDLARSGWDEEAKKVDQKFSTNIETAKTEAKKREKAAEDAKKDLDRIRAVEITGREKDQAEKEMKKLSAEFEYTAKLAKKDPSILTSKAQDKEIAKAKARLPAL